MLYAASSGGATDSYNPRLFWGCTAIGCKSIDAGCNKRNTKRTFETTTATNPKEILGH